MYLKNKYGGSYNGMTCSWNYDEAQVYNSKNSILQGIIWDYFLMVRIIRLNFILFFERKIACYSLRLFLEEIYLTGNINQLKFELRTSDINHQTLYHSS